MDRHKCLLALDGDTDLLVAVRSSSITSGQLGQCFMEVRAGLSRVPQLQTLISNPGLQTRGQAQRERASPKTVQQSLFEALHPA